MVVADTDSDSSGNVTISIAPIRKTPSDNAFRIIPLQLAVCSCWQAQHLGTRSQESTAALISKL